MQRRLRPGALAGIALLLLGVVTTVALVRSPNAMGLLYCGADETRTNATVLALGLGGSPLPVPTDGVVTGWRVVGASAQGRLEQRLQVFRRVDGPVNSFLAVAESSAELTPNGPRQYFKTRIPVESGDLLALRGTERTFVCEDAPGVTSGLHEGPTPIGSSYAFEAEEGLGVPLDVVIEPDEDGDGYGDRTQDRCTRMPTTQDGCPVIDLRVRDATVRERSILFRVTVGTKTEVRVTGQIAVGLRQPAPSVDGILLISLDSGVKTVSPGRTARVAIKLPGPLRRRLDGLPPKRSLIAMLTASAVTVAGREAKRRLTVLISGRKDP